MPNFTREKRVFLLNSMTGGVNGIISLISLQIGPIRFLFFLIVFLGGKSVGCRQGLTGSPIGYVTAGNETNKTIMEF